MCILLICWLPFSIAAAQVMSAQMMLKTLDSAEQSIVSARVRSCHNQMPEKQNPKHQFHQCSACSSCTLASTSVTLSGFLPTLSSLELTSKYLAFEPIFASIQLPPIVKPPILN